MKMYILVKEDIPLGFAMVAAAHASLAAYLKFKDNKEMIEWSSGIFYKTICKVNDSEFENAKLIENNVVLTESALIGKEVAIAFCPREEYPKMFKFFRLFR